MKIIPVTFLLIAYALGGTVVAEQARATGKQTMAQNAGKSAVADTKALATLMAVNEHEIKAAQIAIDKKVGPKVTEYARLMQTAHSDNQSKTQAMAGAAQAARLEDAELRALKNKTAGERARLERLQGEAFEAAYIDAMIKDHAEVLGKLDDELIPSAERADVRRHLQDTRGHVAHHLEEARQIDGRPQAAR